VLFLIGWREEKKLDLRVEGRGWDKFSLRISPRSRWRFRVNDEIDDDEYLPKQNYQNDILKPRKSLDGETCYHISHYKLKWRVLAQNWLASLTT